jgi:hypothetical protein
LIYEIGPGTDCTGAAKGVVDLHKRLIQGVLDIGQPSLGFVQRGWEGTRINTTKCFNTVGKILHHCSGLFCGLLTNVKFYGVLNCTGDVGKIKPLQRLLQEGETEGFTCRLNEGLSDCAPCVLLRRKSTLYAVLPNLIG